MPEDFNPAKYQSPDYAKDEAKSIQFGIGLLLLISFFVSRSVQLFSRVPGSSGAFLVLANFWILVLQACFYQGLVEAGRPPDAIGFQWLLIAQLVWFAYGVMMTFINRARNVEADFADLGVGILYRQMPDSKPAAVGLVSDLLVAGLLSGGFYLLNSPIQGGWYLAVVCWVLFSQGWMKARDNCELGRIRDAQFRARHLSQRMRRRR